MIERLGLRLLPALSALAALLFLATEAAAQSILGRWQAVQGPMQMTFESSGRATLSSTGPARSGRWRLDGNLLTILLDDGRGIRVTVRMPERNRLVLIDPDNRFSEYRRVD